MRNLLDRIDHIYDSSYPGHQLRLYELAILEGADTEAPVTQHLTDQELQTLLPQSRAESPA